MHLARERYLQTYAHFWEQLSDLVVRTQARAEQDAAVHGFPAAMRWRVRVLPWASLAGSLVSATITVFRSEGFLAVLKKLRHWLVRDGKVLVRRLTGR